MTTKNVQVDAPINVMRAALMCAAKDDVRECCNAVRVERKSGKLYVISTRGTILFAHLVGQSDGADVAVTIPRTALSVGVLAGYRATSDSIPSILNDLRAS